MLLVTYNNGVLLGNVVYRTTFICMKPMKNCRHPKKYKHFSSKRQIKTLIWYACGGTI